MVNDDFEAWFGRLGDDRPFRYQIAKAINRAGGYARSAGARARRSHAAPNGRGSAAACLLVSSDRFSGAHARRVVVKARIVRLAGKGAKAAAAHLRYLQRDGTNREGERGTLYGSDGEGVDGKAFLERGKGDRHHFRLIVSAEDGYAYDDLQPLTRRLMQQMEKDLGTRLEWIAVDHFNTGHPHTHIVLRGKDDSGRDLVIAGSYISRGMALRAMELVNLDLGPRTAFEVLRAGRREMEAERFTGIDRRLLRDRDGNGIVQVWHRKPAEQSLRAGRLAKLARMGLAHEVGKGLYRLEDELEDRLRAIGRRGEIAALMHRELRDRPGLAPADYAIFDPERDAAIVGSIVARGLADEFDDRRYLILEATDGRAHYVELGREDIGDPRGNGLVRISAVGPGVRAVDRTVAEVAAANGGRYSIEAHQRHDPGAQVAFAEAHVRRLEAMRRGGGGVERLADGTWTIAPDHLERVEVWGRSRADGCPVRIEVLSDRPLDQLTRRDGPTWLDELCVAAKPERLHGRFGAEVERALARRRQWLIEQDLAFEDGGTVAYRAGLLRALRAREVRAIGWQLARESGFDYAEHQGGRIEGIYRKAVEVGGSKYAVIERSHDLTLVPWRPVLERQIGRHVSGMDIGNSISWRIGRDRGGPER